MEKTLKLHYARLQNMGDLLNPMIVERCFGCKVERNSFLTSEMCAIGSCLGQYCYHGNILMRIRQFFNGYKVPHVYVWGTGFINYDDCKSRFFKRNMEFLAVRGELTRKNLERMTGKPLNIPTGDAGILAPILLDETPEKKYDIGVIPHICDLEEETVSNTIKAYDNVLFINVKDEPLEVIKQIAQCRTIISSSLHGLIVADAYNIPNMHVIFSDKPKGDGYKYDDYYSAYGVKHQCRDLRELDAPSIEDINNSYQITKEMVDEKKRIMLDTFPKDFIVSGVNTNGLF